MISMILLSVVRLSEIAETHLLYYGRFFSSIVEGIRGFTLIFQ